MPAGLDRLERSLGHRFADPGLVRRALTHRSAGAEHNERLEFLGDAVLGLAVADVLYARFPEADEGELSRMRAALVNRDALAAAARDLGLEEWLALGAGADRRRDSVLADALEALLAAVYLDGGLEPCARMAAGWLGARRPASLRAKDRKTRLQELARARGAAAPDYRVESVSGPGHEPRFRVSCRVPLLDAAQFGEGGSRRAAEQEAAGRALELLGEAP